MSHVRPSPFAAAPLLASLILFAGCGGDDGNAKGGTGEAAVKLADSAPCQRLTADMAERVLNEPELGEVKPGADGCLRLAQSKAAKQDGQRAAGLSLSTRVVPQPGGAAPVAMSLRQLKKESQEGSTDTTRKLNVGTDGFMSSDQKLHYAALAWTDDTTTFVLEYNAWESPQPGKVPISTLIAIAREING